MVAPRNAARTMGRQIPRGEAGGRVDAQLTPQLLRILEQPLRISGAGRNVPRA